MRIAAAACLAVGSVASGKPAGPRGRAGPAADAVRPKLGGGAKRGSAAPQSASRKDGTALRSGLLSAIAKAESGRPVPPLPGLQPWPWAVNADGAAMYFDSKPAAVVWTRLALARGVRQVDVGCMQVNLQSHPEAFRDLDDAFDPAANADYAARFLLRLRADAGGDWTAADRLLPFAHTPGLAADYRERVEAIAEGPHAAGGPWDAAVSTRDPARQPADRSARRRGAADQRPPAALHARTAADERVPGRRRARLLHGRPGTGALR